MPNTTITLNQFHNLLAEAYAVCVNDTLYFVGYDEYENPYIADNVFNDYVDLSTVDGDIEVDNYAVSFWVAGDPIRLIFLHIKSPLV